jgi:hypothetical protein
MEGSATYSTSLGDSTIFIGDNTAANVAGKNFTRAFAPITPEDFNFGGKEVGIGWVDPVSDAGLDTWENIVRSIAHEAGHSFGLTHIRTVGADPDVVGALDPKNPPEVMSYDSPNTLFTYKKQQITEWNYEGQDVDNNPIYKQSTEAPLFRNAKLKTQNSFLYLSYLFGTCPWDDLASVADNTVYDSLTWQDKDLSDSPSDYEISPLGDYDVLQLYDGYSGTVHVAPDDGSKLAPIALLYDENGVNLLGYAEAAAGQPLDLAVSTPQGVRYRLVIGAKDGKTQGDYSVEFR